MNENDHGPCQLCEAEVWWYWHSQAGSLRAGAWTSVHPLDPEKDPRYGTRCPNSVSLHSVYPHEVVPWNEEVRS